MNSNNNNTNSNSNDNNHNGNHFVRPGPWSAFVYVLMIVLISYCHILVNNPKLLPCCADSVPVTDHLRWCADFVSMTARLLWCADYVSVADRLHGCADSDASPQIHNLNNIYRQFEDFPNLDAHYSNHNSFSIFQMINFEQFPTIQCLLLLSCFFDFLNP
jgi:hypothetical protein